MVTEVLTKTRAIAGVVNSIETLEGAGFLVRRPFPKPQFSEFDPFLLLDEMGPSELGPGEAKGAPDHPHSFDVIVLWKSRRLPDRDHEHLVTAPPIRVCELQRQLFDAASMRVERARQKPDAQTAPT